MKKNSSLPLLVSLARNHSEKAHHRLRLLLANVSRGEQKLGTLKTFLAEYQQQMLESSSQGMEIGALHNYRMFLAKLNHAVQQQTEEIQALHNNLDVAQKQWQFQERKRLSFETLQERFDKQQEQEQASQVQKLLDAFATQRAARNIIDQK
jgi:flagellar protein FliJ